MVSNARKYASPESYYELTKDRSLSPVLREALNLVGDGNYKMALDFGCGAGGETKYLLEHGYQVTAVEGNPVAAKFINQLPNQDRLHFVLSEMEKFKFENYNFINASRSLPFTHKDTFSSLFANLKASLLPDGIFVGHFFGVNDQWNNPDETMTFLSKEEVLNLLSGLEVLKLNETEGGGRLANGNIKYWHLFEVIAQKNQ